MQIYTSYYWYVEHKTIPEDSVVISIALGSPYWYKCLNYKELAPTPEILNPYNKVKEEVKVSKDKARLVEAEKVYTKRYIEEVLDKLDFDKVMQDLKEKSGGRNIILVCYENPKDFCHRHLVANWFRSHGVEVLELGVAA